ncbi:MAG: TIGR02206 family membrane protein [Solirubrobacterales bacterium]
MDLLAGEHVAALALTAALAACSVWAARAHPGAWITPFSRGLAVLMVAAYVTENVAIALRGTLSVERSLPLHLTDAVTIVSALALWRPRPLLFELAYFWGLTASLLAVLTPDLDSGFPHLFFWTYFATHSGAVVAALFLAFGLRLVPRPGAVPRVLVATLGYAALAAVADLLTGGNYMFLREKPDQASLLDLMGPWPWYIPAAGLLAAAMFAALEIPFRRRRAG